MEDYLDEINTALSMRGEDIYFESIEDVQTALEQQSEEYKDKALNYATLTTAFSGSGIAGKLMPEFYTEISQQSEVLTQNDLSTIGLVGGLGISTVPTYLAKRNKDKRDEIDQLVDDLENGEFDDSETDFAYTIADNL